MGTKDCYGYCRLCPQSIFNIDRRKDGARENPIGGCWAGMTHEFILKRGAFNKRQRVMLGDIRYIPEALK